MKKNRSILSIMLLVLAFVVFTACSGAIEVRGKTFVYESVKINWGTASDSDKETIYSEFLVNNENELLAVLKTRNGRNERSTTFSTDSTYTTVNKDNEVLDSGYYKQDSDKVILAETEEQLSQEGNYILKVNDKGYQVSDVLNSELSIYAVYQYVVNN
jgi:hypothetical protein